MKRFEQDRLLQELLEEDQLSALRRSSLEQGLALVRRQRVMRRAARVLACAVPLILVLALALARLPRSPQQAVLDSSPTTEPTPQVKIITDEQLFALFPNRSMALIGKPGHQQLVFFDQPAPVRD